MFHRATIDYLLALFTMIIALRHDAAYAMPSAPLTPTRRATCHITMLPRSRRQMAPRRASNARAAPLCRAQDAMALRAAPPMPRVGAAVYLVRVRHAKILAVRAHAVPLCGDGAYEQC